MTSTPAPYIIGIKRHLLRDLKIESIGDVIIIDTDSGECQVVGCIENVDILGDAGSMMKHASEKTCLGLC